MYENFFKCRNNRNGLDIRTCLIINIQPDIISSNQPGWIFGPLDICIYSYKYKTRYSEFGIWLNNKSIMWSAHLVLRIRLDDKLFILHLFGRILTNWRPIRACKHYIRYLVLYLHWYCPQRISFKIFFSQIIWKCLVINVNMKL